MFCNLFLFRSSLSNFANPANAPKTRDSISQLDKSSFNMWCNLLNDPWGTFVIGFLLWMSEFKLEIVINDCLGI